MYVPPTTQPAPALVPVGVVSAAPAPLAEPVKTEIRVRRAGLNVLDHHSVTVRGALLEADHAGQAGREIELQARTRRGWRTITQSDTAAGGRFRITYRPGRIGSRSLRLAFRATPLDLASQRRLGRLNVFRLALASWYGGGGETACGGYLTGSTMGVANKTLPCGTLVTLRYGHHMVRVPVIDRGPYVEGREFDLTEATKEALGFEGVGDVWSTG